MKRIPKAKSGFKRLNDDRLIVLGETVFNAMTANAYFSDPLLDLADFELILNDFNDKLTAARKRGSPQDTAMKNESRRDLEKALSELAFYVNKVADGTLSVLLSSGFEISQQINRLTPPELVRNLILRDGFLKEQMLLNFDAQPGARLYEYRITKERDEEGELVWGSGVHITTSSKNNLIESVKAGVVYYVSARAINTRGKGDWSEPVRWMAR